MSSIHNGKEKQNSSIKGQSLDPARNNFLLDANQNESCITSDEETHFQSKQKKKKKKTLIDHTLLKENK